MDIERCLDWYPINPGMSNRDVLGCLLGRLKSVLQAGIPGDVVEMGCHAGDTSIFLARMIQELDPSRTLHLYDSFQGLPAKHPKDNPHYGEPGSVATTIDVVKMRFAAYKLPMPQIHTGWFGELPPAEFPERVVFAFFDGDVYQSIWDSFTAIYPRLSPGAVVGIHDWAVSNWPGVVTATNEYLADKPEGIIPACFLLGLMVKQ